MTIDQLKQQIPSLQNNISAMKLAGQNDDLIVDRIIKNPSIDNQIKQIFAQAQNQKNSAGAISDFLAIKVQRAPMVTKESLESITGEGIGSLGGWARFLGPEKLGRGLAGRALTAFDPQFQENLRKAQEQGVLSSEEVELMKTGGVSKRQLIGSAIQTAGSMAFPFAGRILTGAKLVSPAMKVTKIAKFLTPLELAPIAGIEQFGREIQDDKTIQEALRSAGISAVIVTAAGPVLKGIGKLIGGTVNLISQTFAGTPKKAIDFVVKNPEISKRAINKAIKDESMIFKIANSAQKSVDNIIRKRGAQFSKEITKINQKYIGKKISMVPFVDDAKKVLREYKVLLPNGKWNPQGIITKSSEIKKIKAVLKRLATQKDRTPEALNNLKRFIRNQKSGGASNEFNAIIESIANKTKQTLLKEVPEMKRLLGKYRQMSQLLNVIKKEFGLTAERGGTEIAEEGGEIIIRENTKRVINAFRRMMKEDRTVGELVFKEMEKIGGKQMTADIMAQYFKSFVPPEGFTRWLGLGTGSIAGFIAAITGTLSQAATALPLAAFASPRLTGLMAQTRGRVLSGLEKELPRHLGTIGTALKQTGRQLIGGQF